MTGRKDQTTFSGDRITPLKVQRGLRINILAGALGMAWWVMAQGMPLTMFFEALGSSGAVLGLVSAVMQAAVLLQIPAALFAERLEERKLPWARLTLVSRFIWFLPAVCVMLVPERPQAVAAVTLGVVALSALLQQSVGAFWFSWMADLVPERVRGRFWGIRQTWVMFACLTAMQLAGYILDLYSPAGAGGRAWQGFSLVFILGSIFGCADIIIHLWVPEPRRERIVADVPWPQRILEPLRNREFRLLTMAMGIQGLSLGLLGLGLVYLKKDFPVTYSQLAAITVSGALGTLIFSSVWGYIMDRIGGRALGSILFALIPVLAIVWFFVEPYSTNLPGLFASLHGIGPAAAFLVRLLPEAARQWVEAFEMPQPVWLLVFGSFLGGAVYGGVGLCQLNLVSALSPERGRTMAMAVHWSVSGLLCAAGSLIAGRVMDFFAAHPLAWTFPTGTRFAFFHALLLAHIVLIWGVALPLFLRLKPRKGEPSLRVAFGSLLVANPFRALFNIYAMDASETPEGRARAMLTLGENRTAIAATDLIGKLQDPAFEVREAAASALGAIGTEEAVSALLDRLEDPHCDLMPQIARALRTSRGDRLVDVLIRRLQDEDRETKTEVARTLGEIGDRRATPALLAELRGNDDDKVVAALGEALSQLGELAATDLLVPRIRTATNPVLKTTLNVAVADLLGEPGEFYGILSREHRTPGSEVDRMLRDLRRGIRNFESGNAGDDRRDLIGLTQQLQVSFEEARFPECADVLHALAARLAALRWGEADATAAPLLRKDPCFSAGLSLLEALRGGGEKTGPGALDSVDVLVGLYFIHHRGLKV